MVYLKDFSKSLQIPFKWMLCNRIYMILDTSEYMLKKSLLFVIKGHQERTLDRFWFIMSFPIIYLSNWTNTQILPNSAIV